MMRTARDLTRTYRALDHVFFGDACVASGWRAKWRRFRPGKVEFTWGVCQMDAKVFQLNARLAQPDVPDFVVSAVLYHEMLHHVIGFDHDLDFVRAEQRHPHFWQSERWCAEFTETGVWRIGA